MKSEKTPNYSYTESDKNLFPWLPLTSLDQLDIIQLESDRQPIVIFKHSTRCSISKRVLNLFESEWNSDTSVIFYYLDLIAYREVSNHIAEKFEVEHQSPQLLVIYKGKCVYNESHNNIEAEEVSNIISELGFH